MTTTPGKLVPVDPGHKDHSLGSHDYEIARDGGAVTMNCEGGEANGKDATGDCQCCGLLLPLAAW
jgi:hypothetical protein